MLVNATAGTLESGDIFIEISPKESDGIEIKLDSTVASQFGKKIKQVILKTLTELNVDKAYINATDKGALDCTVRARVTAAVNRATNTTEIKW